MRFYKIDENALGGITGTANIAANPNGGMDRRDLRQSDTMWRRQGIASRDTRHQVMTPQQIAAVKAQVEKARALKAAQQKQRFGNFASRLFSRDTSLGEALDIAGITSQLKGLENKNNYDNRDTVTYGVEDDEGNMMKVTVKADDAKNFETRLALELGEAENNKIYGYQNSGVSLAEVLYNLKDEFNIVDVEFPEIPSDIVYNADKATLGEAPAPMGGNPNVNPMGDDQDEGQMPPSGGADQGGMPPANGGMDANAGAPPADDMGDASMDDGMTDPSMDDQGEDFSSDDGAVDFKSLLQDVLSLMTAQAQKEKAVADAEAEKARAVQAEFSAKSANGEISRQEELVRMEAEMDQQKKKEKEAKRYSDLAKYRVNQSKGANAMNFEGYTSFLQSIIDEDVAAAGGGIDDGLETEQQIRTMMNNAVRQYQIAPTDDQPTQDYKRQALQAVRNELNEKLKRVRAKAVLDQKEKIAQQQTAQQTAQQATQQQQAANNVGGAPTGLTGPQ